MARPPSSQPTDGELEILQILWHEGPAELGVVQNALMISRGRDVAKTTVATMLTVMLEKGLVARTEGRPSRWSARVTQRVATRGLVGRVVDAVFDGSSRGLVAHLIQDGKLSSEDRDEIRRLLDDADDSPRKRRRS